MTTQAELKSFTDGIRTKAQGEHGASVSRQELRELLFAALEKIDGLAVGFPAGDPVPETPPAADAPSGDAPPPDSEGSASGPSDTEPSTTEQ